MAVLTSAELTVYKHLLRNDPIAKAELYSLSPSKSEWTAMMQAIEDKYEADRATYKSDMEAASGLTLTNVLAKKLGKAYFIHKMKGE